MKRQTDPYDKGDEEVNKRIKQKIYIFKQTAQYFGLKTKLLQGLNGKMKIKRKVRYK